MDSPSASERGVPLQFVAIFLDVLTDLVGPHGTAALLRRAGHAEWITAPPLHTLKAFASPESTTALLTSLEELYGPRGSRGLGRRLGAALVDRSLKDLGALSAVADPSFQALPSRTRVRVGLLALGRAVTAFGGFRLDVTSAEHAITLATPDCPFCLHRNLAAPGCSPLVGLVEAGLRLVAPDLAPAAEETACRGLGAAACEVTVPLPASAG